MTKAYNVYITKSAEQDIVLEYETDDASAFQGLDYKKASGQLTIPAGEVEKSIPFEIISVVLLVGFVGAVVLTVKTRKED